MTEPDLDTLFGDVRAALDGAPSPQRWDRLCEALAPTSASEALSERLIPYVESHLSGWPDHLRLAPQRWLLQHALSARAHLLGLCRSVDITRSNLTHRGLTRLLDAWGDRPITHLDLEDCRNISDDGCRAIAASSHAPHLTHLNLNLCSVHPEGFRALHTLTGPLDLLDMSYNSAGHGALTPLLDAGCLAQARVIRLNHCDLTSDDLFALCAQVARGERVEELELRGSRLSNDHAFALTQLPWPRTLELLDLQHLHASPRAAEHLRGAPSLSHVVTL